MKASKARAIAFAKYQSDPLTNHETVLKTILDSVGEAAARGHGSLAVTINDSKGTKLDSAHALAWLLRETYGYTATVLEIADGDFTMQVLGCTHVIIHVSWANAYGVRMIPMSAPPSPTPTPPAETE